MNTRRMVSGEDSAVAIVSRIAPASHKDKVRIILTNTLDRDVAVWTPVWKPDEVHLQMPHASKLRLEGPKGWKAEDWGQEQQCVVLLMGQTLNCWIGLLAPVGSSIGRRLQTGEQIGTAIFPVKIDQQIYDVPVKLPK